MLKNSQTSVADAEQVGCPATPTINEKLEEARGIDLRDGRVTVTEIEQNLKLNSSFHKMEMKTVTGCSVYILYMPSYRCPYNEHTLNTKLGRFMVTHHIV